VKNDAAIKRQINKQRKITVNWLDRYVAQRYMPISAALEKQAKLTAGAMKNVKGLMTYNGLRKLYDVQSLGMTASRQISQLAVEAAGHLQRDAEKFHNLGIDAAAAQALMQFPKMDKQRRTRFWEVSRQKVTPDPQFLQNVMGALPIKAHRLGPLVGEMIEHKLADTMTLSRGKASDKKIDDVVADCLGTGLAFLMGMFLLALWSLYTGGIFRFMNIHADWISGWIWYAVLDLKTCPSCIALHGRRFNRDEVFRDHPHGRCQPVLIVETLPWWWTDTMVGFGIGLLDGDLVEPIEIEQLGRDWFESLSYEKQEEILGYATFRAYRADAIKLADLSGVHNHDVYGKIRLTASLKSILGDEAKKYYVHRR